MTGIKIRILYFT